MRAKRAIVCIVLGILALQTSCTTYFSLKHRYDCVAIVTTVTKGIKTNCENFLAADTDEKRAEDLSCLNGALIQLNDVFSMHHWALRTNILWVERDFLDGLYYNPTISQIQEKLRDDLVGDISYDYY